MRLRLQNLHSTMLLLYQHVIPVLYCVNHHLHSTMLLLYPAEKRDVILIRFHLHSTMLLLYPGRSGHARLPLSFTFHYASTLSISGEIPTRQCLLFTFHYASTLSVQESVIACPTFQFTFHYASTLSCFVISQRPFIRSFTFHYASTLSTKHFLKTGQILHLHSTMLLLYPLSRITVSSISSIYIPLCFYFIVQTH